MNRRLIAERCRAGGLSLHAAAHRAFVDASALLEEPIPEQPWEREVDDRMPLGVVRRLCEILDVSFEQLLGLPAPPPDAPDDDLRVEAALATFPEGISRDALARAFRWPLERVERALGSLEMHLRPTGRRLVRLDPDRVALGPNLSILSTPERQELVRSHDAGPPLYEEDAEVLLMILGRWDRRRDLNPEVSWDQARVLLGRGLVVRVEGEYAPTTDLLFSLGLDDGD